MQLSYGNISVSGILEHELQKKCFDVISNVVRDCFIRDDTKLKISQILFVVLNKSKHVYAVRKRKSFPPVENRETNKPKSPLRIIKVSS